MTLHFTVTDKDYLNFNIYHIKSMKGNMIVYYALRFVFPTIIVLFAVLDKDNNIGGWIAAGILGIIWILIMPKIYWGSIKRSVNRSMRNSSRAGNEFAGERILTLEDDRVVQVGGNRKFETNYENIEKIAYDKECMYLYSGSISAYIVPYSAFASEGEKEEFVRIVKEKCDL